MQENKVISLDELKQIQLDILTKVHDFCVKNNIDYFLSYGTLIGAIRHKGYIPWDDDIDIEMTRPNYEKFLKSFNGAYRELEVYAPELDWNYYAPYANVCDNRTILKEKGIGHNGRVLGIKIDVFPIDGLPSDEALYDKMFKKSRLYNSLLVYNQRDFSQFINSMKSLNLKDCFKWIVGHTVPHSLIQKWMYKLATQYNYSSAKKAGLITFTPVKYSVDKSCFEHYIEVEFEGRTFYTIKDYDMYLRLLYGDYMQLPPIEERIPHHNFHATWK